MTINEKLYLNRFYDKIKMDKMNSKLNRSACLWVNWYTLSGKKGLEISSYKKDTYFVFHMKICHFGNKAEFE